MMRFFSRMWHGETNGMTAAAVIVGGASLASRVVGVLRDRVLASAFGAGTTLDAYYAAFRLPDLLYTLVILGALSAGFIPVFAEYMETRGQDEAWRLAERVLSVIGATLLVVCGLLMVFAPLIVPLTVPGFTGQKLLDTISLTRIMALSPFLLGLSAVMGGVLQATRRFLAFSLAPVFYNLGIIFGASVLAPIVGVQGLAWGVVLGALFHLLTQASVAWKLGVRRLVFPSLQTEGVRRILWLMAPRTAGLAVAQINLVILLGLASALPSGSIAVFNFANNLQSFPVGIFGISFAVAAFPNLAAAAGAKRSDEFRSILVSAGRKMVFLILPATVLFLLLRAQIVRLALGAGAFDWNDTIRTADVLGVFSCSLLFQALIQLVARAFYALQDTWTPLIAGIVSEVVNVSVALVLRPTWGILGLAAAYSFAAAVNFFCLWFLLRRREQGIVTRESMLSFLKTAVACAGLLGSGWLVRQVLGTWFPLRTFWQVALQAGASSIVGLAVFVAIAWALKSPELSELAGGFVRRLAPRQPIAGAEEAQGV